MGYPESTLMNAAMRIRLVAVAPYNTVEAQRIINC
jgi:hypothetical protein